MKALKIWEKSSILLQNNLATKEIIKGIKDWTIELIHWVYSKTESSENIQNNNTVFGQEVFINKGLDISSEIQEKLNSLIELSKLGSSDRFNIIEEIEEKLHKLLINNKIPLLSVFNKNLLKLLEEFNSLNNIFGSIEKYEDENINSDEKKIISERYDLIKIIFGLNITMFSFLKQSNDSWIINIEEFNNTFSDVIDELDIFIQSLNFDEANTKHLESSILKIQIKIGLSMEKNTDENKEDTIEIEEENNYLKETLNLAISINTILEQLQKDTKENRTYNKDTIDNLIEKFVFLEDWWRKNKQEALAKINSYFLELFHTIKKHDSIIWWNDLIKLNLYNVEIFESLLNKWKTPFLYESKTVDILLEINKLIYNIKHWDIVWSDPATHWHTRSLEEWKKK